MKAQRALCDVRGGKVPLRQAVTRPGEKPYLIARVALNRAVLLQAAAQAANCLELVAGACYLSIYRPSD